MSKQSGKGAHGGASKVQRRVVHVHRARKGPRCPACGRHLAYTPDNLVHSKDEVVLISRCPFRAGPDPKQSIVAQKVALDADAKRQAKAKYERARRKAIREAKEKS